MPKGIYPRLEKHKLNWFQKGHKNSVEIVRKISSKLKGKKAWNKGIKLSDEWKENLSKSLKGRISPNKGKRFSKEWRKKLSKAHGGRGDGLTELQIREKIAGRKKPKQCELCGAMGTICFDHDHKTGKFRGWICRRCNATLGLVKDNSELLNSMVKYLNNLI